MAVITLGCERLLVAVDQVLDGVHFDLERDGAKAAGRKAMARNLSDVAAMAVWPIGAVASVALPKGFNEGDAQELYRGLREIGDEFSCPLVGGDVGAWDGRLAISVTIFAKPADDVAPVLRSGARVGDAICVTGKLGGAWRTERHLTFRPRVHEAIFLARKYELRAMIDISDGLCKDLSRVCKASEVGAELWSDSIPIHENALAGRDDITLLQAALGDGEDHELLFTLPEKHVEAIRKDQELPLQVTRIGTITKKTDLILIRGDGSREKLTDTGWEHHT